MGINNIGFGFYESFKSDYRVGNIPKAQVSDVTDVENTSNSTQGTDNIEAGSTVDISTPREFTPINPEDISLTFNRGDDFSYIGSERDINDLDINKAISDMKQDSILQEYNYFVGNANNVFNSEDGRVLAK